MAQVVQSQTQVQTQSFKNMVEEARQRLLQVEKTLNSLVIGHEDFVKALLLASVAGEHIIVIGPPGTAKSYTVKLFAKLVNANFYQYLLTKFTSFDELFGAVDVTSLARGEYRRNWSKIVASEFVFLDEIFKANSAILNALLSLLQERVVYDPISGQPIETKLHTAIGASNETPEDPELQALYDRFAIKVFVDYLNNDAQLFNALVARWSNNAVNGNNGVAPIATMNDIRLLHRYAILLLNAVIKDLDATVLKVYHTNVVPLIKSLREKGVIVSDRTIIEKLPKIYAAYLVLYGMSPDNVYGAVFEIVEYLARTRSELRDINKVVQEGLGEVGHLAQKLEEAKTYMNAMNYQKAKEVLEEILNFDLSKLEKTPWLKPKAEAIMQTARQYLDYIIKVKEDMERRFAQYRIAQTW